MSVNLITTRPPRHLVITQTMLEDFLCDPVLAAKVILGLEFDAFQRCRLRYYWWVPNLIDSSGFSSGKTIVDWAYIALRCLLIPEHDAGVYYPTFETGKSTFWTYFTKIRSPIYHAQLGRTDEKGEEDGTAKSQGAACFKAFYRNGSKTLMPAPSFMKAASTQASLRLNTLLVEEWTHVDAMSTGIDDQLIGRVTKPCFNQHHPIWGNHIHFTAPAKTMMHPAYPRYRGTERRALKGDPAVATVSYSYKDYSDLPAHTGKNFRDEYRNENAINTLKVKMARAEFLGEGLGVWSRSGKGWFTEEAIASCVALGTARGLVPVTTRRQFEELALKWN